MKDMWNTDKDNYWVEEQPQLTNFLGEVTQYGRIRIIDEARFKKKIRKKLIGGLVGLTLGASLISTGFIEEINEIKLNYILGIPSLLIGARKTTNYFLHRKDEKPHSALGYKLL